MRLASVLIETAMTNCNINVLRFAIESDTMKRKRSDNYGENIKYIYKGRTGY